MAKGARLHKPDMKISVSNIAWDNRELEEHLSLLRELSCDGVEIAPSCIWKEPIDATPKEIRTLKKLVGRYGLDIPAFHALTFNMPDLYLFGEKSARTKTISYLKSIIRLAGDLSVKILVYGSPKTRMAGPRSYNECYSMAVAIFSELAEEASIYETSLCIEPLGPSECDFINTADEAYRLIKDIASPCFGLHLDAKAMFDANEDFESVFNKYGGILKHFHVSDPGLAPPGETGLDHSRLGMALSRSGYNGFVSIEMRKGFGDTKDVIKKAVAYVREKYNIG